MWGIPWAEVHPLKSVMIRDTVIFTACPCFTPLSGTALHLHNESAIEVGGWGVVRGCDEARNGRPNWPNWPIQPVFSMGKRGWVEAMTTENFGWGLLVDVTITWADSRGGSEWHNVLFCIGQSQ